MEPETILMNVDRSFQELTDEIEVKIEGGKEARKLKLAQYSGIFQRFKVCWSEIEDLKNLQQILVDVNNDERLA